MIGKTSYEGLSCPASTKNQLTTGCLTYDAAGNVTWDGSLNYLHDLENRMTKFVGSTTDIYLYDGDGQRVKKTTPAVSLYWYGATGNVLDETSGNGTLVSEYIFFNGTRVARRDADNTVKYYFADDLGSASVITNDHGAMTPPLAESDYYPYGGEIPITSGDPNHYKFTGKERDSESGLDNFGARYDASSLGRFMSPDPLGGHNEDPQTLNRYAYVRNNPLSLTDPTGLDFNLRCQPTAQNVSTCQGGHVGTTDDKGNFTATVVTSDSIRAGQNSANVDQNGVEVTTGGKSYSGQYFDNPASHTTDASGNDENHNPITLQGDASKGLGGFSFNVNGNCGGMCLSAGSVQFNGTPDQARAALKAAGSWNYGFLDTLNSTEFGHHPYTDQFRFGGPGPSLHVSVPWDYLPNADAFPTQSPFSTVPMTGGFHTDATTGSSHFWCANFGVGCN